MPTNVAPLLQAHLAPSTLELTQRLGEAAARAGMEVYLVGGPVRDVLLGKAPVDLDLALEGDASALVSRLVESADVRVLMRSQFLTYKLRIGETTVDLATARRERYPSPGALPQVEAASLQDDLRRRDFTINAMAIALTPHLWGELQDPFGGQADLAQGLVRALHPGSFQDDATRIVRGIRYEQRLGFRLEQRTEELVRQDASFLKAISPDRLRHEVDRILQEPAPERVLERAQEMGVLSFIHPSLRWDATLLQAALRLRQQAWAEPLAYLGLLAHSLTAQEAQGLIARLNMPSEWRQVVEDMRRLPAALLLLGEDLKPSQAEALLREYTPASLEAAWAMETHPDLQLWLQDYLTHLRHVRPHLTGDDLQALGVAPGPLLGRLLDALHRACLDGEATTREEEVALVRRWLE